MSRTVWTSGLPKRELGGLTCDMTHWYVSWRIHMWLDLFVHWFVNRWYVTCHVPCGCQGLPRVSQENSYLRVPAPYMSHVKWEWVMSNENESCHVSKRHDIPPTSPSHIFISLTRLFSDLHTSFANFLWHMFICLTSLFHTRLCHIYIHLFNMSLFRSTYLICSFLFTHIQRGGGLGSRPQKIFGESLGDGVEYHLMSPTPRRHVPFTTGRRAHEISWIWYSTPAPHLWIFIPPTCLVHTSLYTNTHLYKEMSLYTYQRKVSLHISKKCLCTRTLIFLWTRLFTHILISFNTSLYTSQRNVSFHI